ncbi:MAG: type 4a pilus biogenesis protein PilO [Desulfamplus sp.]|nr:type 4a pilus biogenesis protein PilO [Desulfamplus sp.]
MKKDKIKISKEPTEKKPFKTILREKTAPFFEKVGRLSKMQRILICVLTLSAMLGSYYYFFLIPRQEAILSLEQKHEELSQQLVTYQAKAARLNAVKKKKEEKEEEFFIALAALPDAKEIPALLTAVSKSGNESGLEFMLFKPEAEVIKDFYAEIPVSINVKGGYHQLALFFDRVSLLSRIVNIKDIVINYDKGGVLTAACKAVTYRFIPKAETEATAEAGKADKRTRKK